MTHSPLLSLLFRVWSIVTLTRLIVIVHGEAEQVEQNYVDDTTGTVKSFNPNEQIQIRIVNKSKYRADIYYDDGMYGSNVGDVTKNGGEFVMNTFAGHQFYVTRHGVREGLFHAGDDTTDTTDAEPKQVRFEAGKPNQVFEIPRTAKPSSNPCQDRFAICERIARRECTNNPGWMIVHCCQSCEPYLDSKRLIDPKVRCTREALNMTEPAWKPGDLNKLFESWATEEKFKVYEPNVVSSPDPGTYGGIDGPWVLTFDNFMTDEEADALVKGGNLVGFQRSTDQGATNALGEQEKIVSTTRTSSNAWCTKECEQLPGVKALTGKIEDVTGIPRKHYESFQILDYGPKQFYRKHHDSSPKREDDVPAGPRIMTFFLYLSDVEEGGETHFNNLGISVKPKKGRALIWPSVIDSDPGFWDKRMYHEAKDVIKGKKYAANHWIHLYDYETPNLWGCTGSFS